MHGNSFTLFYSRLVVLFTAINCLPSDPKYNSNKHTKNNLKVYFPLLKMILFGFFMLLLFSQSRAEASKPVELSGSRVAVKFKNDIKNDQLTISVKGGNTQVMNLFIFTADGVLVNQVAVSSSKLTITRGLKKGLYLYECFNEDQRMKSGSLLIK